jgi:hypothetical protein
MSIFKRAAHCDTTEVVRLRAALADRDRQLAELARRVDDLLDRESMHVYDPDMERLTTAAAIERQGARREQRRSGRGPVARAELKVTAGTATELTIAASRTGKPHARN